MAYRRSIVGRTKSFYQQQQRLAPSLIFSQFSTSDRDRDRVELHASCITRNSEMNFHSFIGNRFLKTRNNISCNSQLRNVVSQIGMGYGLVSHRNFSSASGGEAVCFEVLNDVVSVVGDKAVEVAPVMNEVAVAAAGSFSPLAELQYLVGHVHCYTGYSWWASIAVTTLLLSSLELPFFMLEKIAVTKHSIEDFGKVITGLERLEAEDSSPTKDFNALKNSLKKVENIFEDIFGGSGRNLLYGGMAAYLTSRISYYTSIAFFCAILDMADNVPSFATGGALWFTDLTTPDSLRLLALYALTYWISLELDSIHFSENRPGKNARMFVRTAAVLFTVTLGLPKAIYCYGITSNLFSIALSIVMMDPLVLKLLGISTGKKTR